VGSISIKFKKELKPCLVVVVSDIFQQRPVFSEELIMALETATYIDGLVITNPAATDGLAQADDHMRLIKSTIKTTFPNVTGAINATHTEVNVLDGITASTSELNILDGVTATAAEINHLSGATSNIQTQLTTLSSSVTGLNTDLVNDTTPQLSGTLDTNGQAIAFGNWTISIDGSNNLSFAYAGDVKLRITAAGALDVEDDITAFSGI